MCIDTDLDDLDGHFDDFDAATNSSSKRCKQKASTWLGFVCAAVAIVFFGINFLPVKKIETGDGRFSITQSSWHMLPNCSAIHLHVISFCWACWFTREASMISKFRSADQIKTKCIISVYLNWTWLWKTCLVLFYSCNSHSMLHLLHLIDTIIIMAHGLVCLW